MPWQNNGWRSWEADKNRERNMFKRFENMMRKFQQQNGAAPQQQQKGAAQAKPAKWECANKACAFPRNFAERDSCFKCGSPRAPKIIEKVVVKTAVGGASKGSPVTYAQAVTAPAKTENAMEVDSVQPQTQMQTGQE